jgi:hypothetical protein
MRKTSQGMPLNLPGFWPLAAPASESVGSYTRYTVVSCPAHPQPSHSICFNSPAAMGCAITSDLYFCDFASHRAESDDFWQLTEISSAAAMLSTRPMVRMAMSATPNPDTPLRTRRRKPLAAPMLAIVEQGCAHVLQRVCIRMRHFALVESR